MAIGLRRERSTSWNMWGMTRHGCFLVYTQRLTTIPREHKRAARKIFLQLCRIFTFTALTGCRIPSKVILTTNLFFHLATKERDTNPGLSTSVFTSC